MGMTSRLTRIAASTGLLAATAVQAQNLIQNPYFEDHLTNWQYDPPDQVSWTNTLDYPAPDSGVPGAMQLDGSRGPVLALQCVAVRESLDYVASMRVQSHCTGQLLHVFWTDVSCIGGSAFVSAASTHADQWDLVGLLAHPAPGAQRAIVVAENPGGCDDPAFVDDVVFETDIIFANGFESPIPP